MKAEGGPLPGSRTRASRETAAWSGLGPENPGLRPPCPLSGSGNLAVRASLSFNPNKTQVVLKSHVRWKEEMA